MITEKRKKAGRLRIFRLGTLVRYDTFEGKEVTNYFKPLTKNPVKTCIATVVGAWEWSKVSNERDVVFMTDPRRFLQHYNPDGQGYVLMLSEGGNFTLKYVWLGEQLDGHLKLVQLCKVNRECGTL